MKILVLAIVLAFGPGARLAIAAQPAPPATTAPAPTVADIAWLVGAWEGAAWDGAMEEIWTTPQAGSMFAFWRFIRNNETVLTELMAVESRLDGVVMWLRHFGPGLVAWEEKDAPLELPLVAASPTSATFRTRDGATTIVYELRGAELVVGLEKARPDGAKPRRDEIVYHRAPASAPNALATPAAAAETAAPAP